MCCKIENTQSIDKNLILLLIILVIFLRYISEERHNQTDYLCCYQAPLHYPVFLRTNRIMKMVARCNNNSDSSHLKNKNYHTAPNHSCETYANKKTCLFPTRIIYEKVINEMRHKSDKVAREDNYRQFIDSPCILKFPIESQIQASYEWK